MRSNRRVIAALCTSLAAFSGTASGHHAFSAQYDSDKPASLTGVVTRIEWLNPHAYFFVDVTDEATGDIVSWACELTSPVGLMRQGWTRNSMKVGDVVAVDGILARDGSSSLNARTVVLTATGQRLFGRTPSEERASGAPSP